jgi:dipeptidyl aminopeptidase/acylaminoacyl peptidase
MSEMRCALDRSKALEFVEKVIRIPSLELLALSKDGRFAVVLSDITGSYQLWSADVRTGELRQVSHGDQRVSFADVSPDSKTVAFTRDFGGAERHQFFLAPIDGLKEETRVSDLQDVRAFDFEWSPDGKEIAFCGGTAQAQHLWTLDPRTRRQEELYSQRGSISSPVYSPDGDRIAVSAKTTTVPRSPEVLVAHRRTGEVTTYTPRRGSENSGTMLAGFQWHPDGQKLLFRTNARGSYDLAVYDYREQKLTQTNVSGLTQDFVSFGWAPKGNGIWFVGAKNGRTRLYLKTGRGKPRLVPTPKGRIGNAKLSRDGSRFVFSWSSLSSPPGLWKLDLQTRKTSAVYRPSYDERLPLGKAEFLRYRSTDGLKIPAFMLFSGSKQPGPVVVWPHGGPWDQISDVWHPAVQAICTAGFHVFCPNFRGSTGYGSDFERMDIGDPGGMDMQDVVAGVKLVKEKGFVEDGKVGIVGASYGGFMTFLCMTKEPDLWRAGAAIVGVTDWKEMYDLSDAAFREFIVELLGKPEENASLYRDRSAINFVFQIKAPILIWHRANDSRCPLQPVQKFADQLKALGKSYELHVVEGEGHGHQKADNLVKQYAGVVSFLLGSLA